MSIDETMANNRGPASSFPAFAAGFFFSFRAAIVLLCVRVLGTEPRTGSELSLALGLLLLGLACFHSLGAGTRTFASMLRPSSIRWVMVFLGVSCCSLAWSETVSLSTSAAYWCGMATDFTIMIVMLRAGSATGAAHSLMKGFLWSTCCLALVAWMMPAQSDLRLGDEQFFNTNQIGNLCAFGIFLAQYLIRCKDGKWGVAAFFLALTLLRSLSKTTILAFVLSEGLLVFQDRSMSRRTKLVLAASAMFVILVFSGLLEAYYNIYTSTDNQAESLTGRTAVWLYVLNAATEHLWLGHGFDSMWKVVPPFGPDRFEARHAENELLQQFYAYGVTGVVVLFGIYGSFYRGIRRIQPGALRTTFSGLLLFIVIRGFAEAEAFDLLLPLWAVVLIGVLADCAGPRSQQATAVAVQEHLYSSPHPV